MATQETDTIDEERPSYQAEIDAARDRHPATYSIKRHLHLVAVSVDPIPAVPALRADWDATFRDAWKQGEIKPSTNYKDLARSYDIEDAVTAVQFNTFMDDICDGHRCRNCAKVDETWPRGLCLDCEIEDHTL